MKIKDVYIILNNKTGELLMVAPDQGSIDEEMPIVNDLRKRDENGKCVFYYAKRSEEVVSQSPKKRVHRIRLDIVNDDGEIDKHFTFVCKLDDVLHTSLKGISDKELSSDEFYKRIKIEVEKKYDNVLNGEKYEK